MSLLSGLLTREMIKGQSRALKLLLQDLLQQIKTHRSIEELKKRKQTILYTLCATAVLAVALYLKFKQPSPKRITFDQFTKREGDEEGLYDVAIVGAGPRYICRGVRSVCLVWSVGQFPKLLLNHFFYKGGWVNN